MAEVLWPFVTVKLKDHTCCCTLLVSAGLKTLMREANLVGRGRGGTVQRGQGLWGEERGLIFPWRHLLTSCRRDLYVAAYKRAWEDRGCW